MGLAASQARLLELTVRNHNLVYQGQQIEQQRLVLAQTVQEATEKYTKAMNNTIMQATVNGETQPLTYDLITNQDPCSGLCMRLVDNNGNVVIPGESIEVQKTSTDADSKSIAARFSSASEFVNTYMKDLSDDKKIELSSYSLTDIYTYYNNQYEGKDQDVTIIHRTKSTSDIVNNNEKVLYDNNVYDSEYLHQMLVSGEFKLQKAKADGTFEDIVWQGSNCISEVLDKSDDAAAEAEYQAAMTQFQNQDKIYEMELKRLETEQNAVHTEKESVRRIIDKNIEDSFKTFA